MLQINNKFNIGDIVYIMYNNKIQKGIIDQMKIHAYKEEELKSLTYEDICINLFTNKSIYLIHNECIEQVVNNKGCYDYIVHYPNNGTSHRQLDKLLAINKLVNVAKYLNNGWEPNWNNHAENKYYIMYDNSKYALAVTYCDFLQSPNIYFKTRELALKAIEILGYDCVKLAIAENW